VINKISLYKPVSKTKPKEYVNLKTLAYKKVYLQYVNTVDFPDEKLSNFINKYKIPAAEMEKILAAGISNKW